MATTDEKNKTGAGAGAAAATETKKVRRLNMATEEYVVGTDTDAKNKTLKGFSNLYPARNEAKAQIKTGDKEVKIWVREIATQKLVEHVDSYQPAPKKAEPEPKPAKTTKKTKTETPSTPAAGTNPVEKRPRSDGRR